MTCPRGVASLYPWLWDFSLAEKEEPQSYLGDLRQGRSMAAKSKVGIIPPAASMMIVREITQAGSAAASSKAPARTKVNTSA